jgi:ketosteroid isomerase-like protein
MSEENVEIVRRLYEAWNQTRGVPPMDRIDADIDVEFRGGILDGRYRGRAGLTRALETFWSSFDQSRIDVETCTASGDDVLVALRYFARGKASGVDVDAPGWHVWTLRNGKAVRWLVLGTEREALKAAGLSE